MTEESANKKIRKGIFFLSGILFSWLHAILLAINLFKKIVGKGLSSNFGKNGKVDGC